LTVIVSDINAALPSRCISLLIPNILLAYF
jgi:hypothetical protein